MEADASLKGGSIEMVATQVSDMVISNWHYLIVFMFLLFLSAMSARRWRRRVALKKRMDFLEREKDSLHRMISNVQKRYFMLDKMGKSDYDVVMEKYLKRLAVLEKDMLFLGQK